MKSILNFWFLLSKLLLVIHLNRFCSQNLHCNKFYPCAACFYIFIKCHILDGNKQIHNVFLNFYHNLACAINPKFVSTATGYLVQIAHVAKSRCIQLILKIKDFWLNLALGVSFSWWKIVSSWGKWFQSGHDRYKPTRLLLHFLYVSQEKYCVEKD